MLNHFSKIIFVFFLCIALQNYAMETNYECNQPSYNPEANAELLQIINTVYEQLAMQKDWENIIKCLEKGANPNLKGKDEISLLALSSSKKTKEYFYYLLKHGADPNICDTVGYSPLHALFAHKNPQDFDPEMLETLLQYNANPNVPCSDKIPTTQENFSIFPLDSAIVNGNENSVKILIKYGANINAKSSYIRTQPVFFHDSITPLVRAMLYNKLEIMRVLCRNYASLENISNFHEETAFGYALKVLKNPEPAIKTLIVNARFKLPAIEKKLDLTALTLLLIFKNQKFKFQIPEDLKFRILSILPVLQKYTEPDCILYQKLFYKNYKNPYFFSRLQQHITNIVQILNKKNKLGKNSISLLAHHEKTKAIMPQLNKDVADLIKSDFKETSPDNLALQICNNYKELLEEQNRNKII